MWFYSICSERWWWTGTWISSSITEPLLFWHWCFSSILISFSAHAANISKQILCGNFMLFYKEMKYRSFDIFMDVNKHRYIISVYTHTLHAQCVVLCVSMLPFTVEILLQHATVNHLLMLNIIIIIITMHTYIMCVCGYVYTIIDVSVVHDLSILWT